MHARWMNVKHGIPEQVHACSRSDACSVQNVIGNVTNMCDKECVCAEWTWNMAYLSKCLHVHDLLHALRKIGLKFFACDNAILVACKENHTHMDTISTAHAHDWYFFFCSQKTDHQNISLRMHVYAQCHAEQHVWSFMVCARKVESAYRQWPQRCRQPSCRNAWSARWSQLA